MNPLDDMQFKKKLVTAYQTDRNGIIPPDWQANLMRDIRAIGPLTREKFIGPLFYDLVWRLAPAMSILLAVLITGVFTMDLSFLQETFMDDPMAVIYNGIFWG